MKLPHIILLHRSSAVLSYYIPPPISSNSSRLIKPHQINSLLFHSDNFQPGLTLSPSDYSHDNKRRILAANSKSQDKVLDRGQDLSCNPTNYPYCTLQNN